MKKWNHVFSIAFSIESEFNPEQTENISAADLIAALEKRVADIKAMPELEAGECFNAEADSFEVETDNELHKQYDSYFDECEKRNVRPLSFDAWALIQKTA